MRKLVLAVLLLAASTACGPVVSGVQIVNADIALSAAKTADADVHAPYEYTAAQVYLQKAREENAYSDFHKSREYADKALDYAVRARKKAEAVAGQEQTVVLPEPQQ